MRKTWKRYVENLHHVDTEELVIVHIWGFDGAIRGIYWGGEPISRTKLEIRLEKLEKSRGELVINWVLKLCIMTFESDVAPEDW